MVSSSRQQLLRQRRDNWLNHYKSVFLTDEMWKSAFNTFSKAGLDLWNSRAAAISRNTAPTFVERYLNVYAQLELQCKEFYGRVLYLDANMEEIEWVLRSINDETGRRADTLRTVRRWRNRLAHPDGSGEHPPDSFIEAMGVLGAYYSTLIAMLDGYGK